MEHISVSTRKALPSKQLDLRIYCCEAVQLFFLSFFLFYFFYFFYLGGHKAQVFSGRLIQCHCGGEYASHKLFHVCMVQWVVTLYTAYEQLSFPCEVDLEPCLVFLFFFSILIFAILYYLDLQGWNFLCACKCTLKKSWSVLNFFEINCTLSWIIKVQSQWIIRKPHRSSSPPLPPKLCQLWNLKWLTNFAHIVQSLLSTCCLFDIRSYIHT